MIIYFDLSYWLIIAFARISCLTIACMCKKVMIRDKSIWLFRLVIFFILMIYKFVMMVAWRRDSSSSDRNYGDERMSSATLLGIFVRDGTLYFFLYGWNSVRKFGTLRDAYNELRATHSACSIIRATLINITLPHIFKLFLFVIYWLWFYSL